MILDYKYSTILKMAVPLMGSSFIQSVVMITDSSFLSRYDTIAFDSAGNGGMIYVTMFVVIMGLSDASQVIMARRIGEKKDFMISGIFGTTLFSNLILALLLFTIMQTSLPTLIDWFTSNSEIAVGQKEFIATRSYGLFFAMIALTVNAYLMAIGKTRLVLIGALITAVSNILLDYSLIFGNLGAPELGLHGAALASTCADASGMLFLFTALYFNQQSKEHQLFKKMRLSNESLQNLFKVGTPIMLQGLIALLVWTVFFIWIEQLGTHELTISQTIRSLYFLMFVPIWGFAGTIKTYVSQYIGDGQFDEIKIVQRRVQILSILFLFITTHGAIFYPEALISLINPDPVYLAESAQILRFLSGSIFIYGFSNVYLHSITGSGNTIYTFIVELIAVTLYLLSAYLFIKVFSWDIYWIWSVEYIYFITMGVFSFTYLKLFNWKKKTI